MPRPVPATVAFAASLAAFGLLARAAAARPCEPLHIVTHPAKLPPVWRDAVDALVAATSREGQPWSCPGGESELRLDEGEGRRAGATLFFRDPAGRAATRRVPSAAMLVPIGEALLAAVSVDVGEPVEALSGHPAPPAPTADETQAGRDPRDAPPDAAPAPAKSPTGAAALREPRALVDGLGGVRYGGAMRALWGTATARVAVPFGPWSAGIWARYAQPYVFDPLPIGFAIYDTSIGLSAGRRVLAAPVELDVTFDPSIALVQMETGDAPSSASGAKLDGRLGVGLRAALPFSAHWRGVLALDGEIAPVSAAHARLISPLLPALPWWSMGLSGGLEVAVR